MTDPFGTLSQNLPWAIWWGFAIVSCLTLEAFGFKHPERVNTFSRFMAGIGARWPLSIGLIMFVLGGLCVHFWWPWCPTLMAPGNGG